MYYGNYGNGFRIGAATVAPDGGLARGGQALVSEDWGYLLDAHPTAAYVTVGGSVLARYRFAGTIALTDWTPVMGMPHRMRFGRQTAYASAGYFGLATLPY